MTNKLFIYTCALLCTINNALTADINLNVIQSETAQMDCGPIDGDFYYNNSYPNGISVDNIPGGGITTTDNILTIHTVSGKHENIYYCSSGGAGGTLLRTFNLTVLAIVVFAGCGVVEECDDNLLLTFEEGEKIIVNISLDYIGGGPRGQNQEINFIFLKNSATNPFSCKNPQECCDNRIDCRNVPNPDIPIILEIVAQQYANISDSGVYTAEVELEKGNQIESITSKLTINVTKSTAPPEPSSTISVVMTTPTTESFPTSLSLTPTPASSSPSGSSPSFSSNSSSLSLSSSSSSSSSSSYSFSYTFSTSSSSSSSSSPSSSSPTTTTSERDGNTSSATYLPVVISILIFVMIIIFLGLAVGIAFCIRGNSKKMMNKSESLHVNSYVKHSQTLTYEPTSPKAPSGQHSISMQQESVIYEQIVHNVTLSQEPNSKTSTV